jgi:cytoskeletal protein RodZ
MITRGTSTKMTRGRALRVLGVLGAAGILAGCSSPSPAKSSSDSTTTSTTAAAAKATTTSTSTATSTSTSSNGASTSAPSSTTTSVSTTTVPANVPNQDAVRKNVILKNCASSSGGWSAGGVVNNPSASPTTYKITIFFTSTGATDLASGSTSVPLNAHGSALWSVKATFAAPSQVLCVLRGVGTS